MSESLRQVSIVLLLKKKNILLAMKKRGFGQGLWNGVGGKSDPGETIEDTAIRECQEEISVTPTKLTKVAILNFYSPPPNSKNNQQAYVFVSEHWEGEPTESEEMSPQWFSFDSIPYSKMWPGDKHWLPLVLDGKKLDADFTFDDDNRLLGYEIRDLD
jgi:8-oxo-dGTP pyrophosphatase MutT (NUDIX family)